VVVVMRGFEIHEEGRVAVETKGCGGKERSLQAMTFALAQGACGRPRRVGVLVGQGVQKALDFYWGVEGAEGAQSFRLQAEGREAVGLVWAGSGF